MKDLFKIGDVKEYSKVVADDETATFASGQVHPLYATFALAKDAEWACRLFVLDMKDDEEEGIGTFVEIKHHAPAKVGSKVDIKATITKIEGHEIICSIEAKVGDRLIASGSTGQKILSKEKVAAIMAKL